MRLRSPEIDEAPAVFELLQARDTADFGVPDCTLEDVRDEWTASSFDLELDARVCVDDDGAIIGYASVRRPGTQGVVHPEREGLGAGTLLLQWSEHRQREAGWTTHNHAVAAGNARARELLERAGYQFVRMYSRMVRDLTADAPEPPLPAGIAFRAPDPGNDAEALYQLDRESFATAADAGPESFREFAERHLGAHDFDAPLSAVATRGGQIVGFLLVRRWSEESAGFVDILAVAPAEQGKGIGRALLLGAFARCRSAGLAETQLGVASDNPTALRLYEGVGMSPRLQNAAYERPVNRGDAAPPR